MKARAFIHINNGSIIANNNSLFAESKDHNGDINFDLLYKLLAISYAKYHKMDNLSKLGFLGVELLKLQIDFKEYDSGSISQIFTNSYSSLDTDVKHQHAINKNKMPSPAIFVYTLPNIVMGEIAIRNKFYGENLFILADDFSPNDWLDLAMIQLNTGKAEAVLGGWIELFENKFDLRLYFLDNIKENGKYEIK